MRTKRVDELTSPRSEPCIHLKQYNDPRTSHFEKKCPEPVEFSIKQLRIRNVANVSLQTLSRKTHIDNGVINPPSFFLIFQKTLCSAVSSQQLHTVSPSLDTRYFLANPEWPAMVKKHKRERRNIETNAARVRLLPLFLFYHSFCSSSSDREFYSCSNDLCWFRFKYRTYLNLDGLSPIRANPATSAIAVPN